MFKFPLYPKTNAWYFSSVLIFSSNPRVLAKNSAHVAYTLLTHRAPRSQGKGKRGRNHPSWRILRACDVIFLLPLLTNHLQFFFSFLKTRVVSLASQLHQLWLIAASVEIQNGFWTNIIKDNQKTNFRLWRTRVIGTKSQKNKCNL